MAQEERSVVSFGEENYLKQDPHHHHHHHHPLLRREMEHTEVVKPETLDDLIQTLHKIFESDSINVEEVQDIMEAYESNPQEWMKYAKFDQYR